MNNKLTIETIQMTDHIEYRVTTDKEVQWFRWSGQLIEYLVGKYGSKEASDIIQKYYE